jgi:hypothetical protein
MKHKACQERENRFQGKLILRFMSTNPKLMDLAWDIPIFRSTFLQYKVFKILYKLQSSSLQVHFALLHFQPYMMLKLFKFIIFFTAITTSASPISSLEFRAINERDCGQSCAKGAVAFCCGQQGFECSGGNEITFTCSVPGETCIITPEGIGCG